MCRSRHRRLVVGDDCSGPGVGGVRVGAGVDGVHAGDGDPVSVVHASQLRRHGVAAALLIGDVERAVAMVLPSLIDSDSCWYRRIALLEKKWGFGVNLL